MYDISHIHILKEIFMYINILTFWALSALCRASLWTKSGDAAAGQRVSGLVMTGLHLSSGCNLQLSLGQFAVRCEAAGMRMSRSRSGAITLPGMCVWPMQHIAR